VRIVPGVEISARLGEKEIHVLGHFVDPSHGPLLGGLESFRRLRVERAERMVERLRAHGAALPLEEVLAGEGSIGRPHLARLLVAHGHARDFQEAFDRWLGKGKPGWVERSMPDFHEAIGLIRTAGGVASLAHPWLSKVAGDELAALARAGLSGVEVDHPHQGADVRRNLRLAAASLGLEATAGSDFHGEPGSPGQESMDEEAFRRYEAAAG
ncbi:MAG TPA: PHP domain-containing protein, partial [Vulgatibacter sp.]